MRKPDKKKKQKNFYFWMYAFSILVVFLMLFLWDVWGVFQKKGNKKVAETKSTLAEHCYEAARQFKTRDKTDKTKLRLYSEAHAIKEKLDPSGLEEIENQAKQGDAHSQYVLGHSYFQKKKYDKAVYWTKMAVAQNYVHAIALFGYFSEEGIGTPQDPHIAVRCYKESIKLLKNKDREHFQFFNLALCYQNGRGVEKDTKQALYWALEAAKRNSLNAMNWVGKYYSLPETKDDEQAFFWFQKAAERGVAESQDFLARCYEHGIGTSRDEKLALEWYHRAAENQIDTACARLSMAYFSGDFGLRVDHLSSWRFSLQAAELGNESEQVDQALFSLGTFGGREIDYKNAYKWLSIASENGNEKAKNILRANFVLSQI